ncbi:MAG TPA: SRPBCC family protein [Kofleriaceae bacterium]|nr:SRPBCC family protein [Kofleriaceae bacterium]
MGLREIAAGLGIFARPSHPVPMWNRVLGDAIDMGLLAYAFREKKVSGPRLAFAMANVLGVGALDVLAAMRLQKAEGKTRPIVKSITINRAPSDVYAFWRNLSSLPVFMRWLDSVTELEGGRSRWVAKLPTGNKVEWEARITEDIPGQRIAWETIGGIGMTGAVDFVTAPGNRGTEIRVKMMLLTGGRLGVSLAKAFAGPEIGGDLRRFKQVLETGEIVKSDASIHKGKHAAQPSADPGVYEYEANRATMMTDTTKEIPPQSFGTYTSPTSPSPVTTPVGGGKGVMP